MNARRDGPEGYPVGGYVRLRPASSKPLGVLTLAAVSRVGAWTPPLPPRSPGAQDARQPIPHSSNDARNA